MGKMASYETIFSSSLLGTLKLLLMLVQLAYCSDFEIDASQISFPNNKRLHFLVFWLLPR